MLEVGTFTGYASLVPAGCPSVQRVVTVGICPCCAPVFDYLALCPCVCHNVVLLVCVRMACACALEQPVYLTV